MILTYQAPRGNSVSNHPEKFKSTHHPRQNFFSFGTWLDSLKSERNPKFQVQGSSGTLLFQSFRIEPLDQKMTATMREWGLPYVS